MRGNRGRARFVAAAAVALAVGARTGCQTAANRKVAAAEPGLSGPIEPGAATVVTAPVAPERKVNFVDRHPLLSKPRDIYASTGSNKVVKTAAATVIGIPTGLFGELKQIVVGKPAELK